jgi:hypothetical protein
VNVLIETLQKRVAELEAQNLEQQRDLARYENGRIVLGIYWRAYHELMDKYVRPRSPSSDEASPSSPSPAS